MEVIIFTLGRKADNDVIYDDASISGHHATIHISYDNQYVISDLTSTNGTFVNGVRIAKSPLIQNDDLRLGTYTIDVVSLLSILEKKNKERKTDFSMEFNQLLPVFNAYEIQKNKILHPSKWPLIIRAILSICILIVLIFFGDWIPNNTVRYALIMSVGLFSVFASLFRSSAVKRNQELDLLKIKYEDQLVCPKCSFKMINQSITYWKGKKKCINNICDASY